MDTRRFFALMAAWLTATLLAVLSTGAALAQDAGPPPWPILLEGTAVVNGTAANGELTARIGDWESPDVPVVDGAFGCLPCLIIGPPTSAYVGQDVTFVLSTEVGKYQAELKFQFPSLPEPSKNSADLVFERLVPTPTNDDEGLGWRFVLLAAAGGATVALVVGAALMRQRRRGA